MFIRKFKYLALTASVTAVLCQSAQAASTITIAVTPMAANAIVDLVTDFLIAYPTATYGYSVSVQVMPDAIAKDAIIAGTAPAPDLFLSQSFLAPLELQLQHPTLVSGNPFPYAEDPLVLYSSAANNVDISAGIPPINQLQPFSIPDPAKLDPYGLTAALVLNKTYLAAVSKNLVLKTASAGSAYALVEYFSTANGGTAYGFTGKSQICTAVTGVDEFEPGSFHHEYTNVPAIKLAGIKLASTTRTTTQEAELTDFITFLTGAGSINFSQHCFKLPGA